MSRSELDPHLGPKWVDYRIRVDLILFDPIPKFMVPSQILFCLIFHSLLIIIELGTVFGSREVED